METKDLLIDINHEVDSVLSSSEEGAVPHEAFLEWCIDELTEIGETEDLNLSNFNRTGQAVHGFTYSDYDNRLDLYITEYRNSTEEYTLYRKEAEVILKRLENFFTKTSDGKNKVDIHEPAHDLIDLLQKTKISVVRFFLLTNGKSTILRTEDKELAEVPTQTHIWDISRFLRNKSKENKIEDTDIIVTDYNIDHINCSATSFEKDKIKTYLCIIPGNFLADVYFNYTSKLLERNVRSFLSFKSHINKGILKTIENEPDNFLAYNNGLTAVASSVKINDRQNKIIEMNSFQIVNGGQTTNTIYRAKYVNKENIDQVNVSMKLCVLDPQDMEQFGAKISQFANMQNVIRKTDLTSNNKIYREIEGLSRKTYAPAVGNEQIETKWYFERTRGQYQDDLSRKYTRAQKREYEKIYPRQQKIDKSQLAKYWGVWYQQIEDVSQGPEKFHTTFIDDIEINKKKFDLKNTILSYQKLIAMAIIYKSSYKRIKEKKYGYSYPGNVTDYSISLISNLCAMKFDIQNVWKTQQLPNSFIKNLDYLAPIVGDTIKNICDENGLIAREVARGRKIKGQSLWQILLEKKLQLPENFIIGDDIKNATYVSSTGRAPLTEEQSVSLDKVKKFSAEQLWLLSKWAKETDNLQSYQRAIVASVAKNKSMGKDASGKQAVQVLKSYEEAKSMGFKFE